MDQFYNLFMNLVANWGTEFSQISSRFSFAFWRWTKVLWVWNNM